MSDDKNKQSKSRPSPGNPLLGIFTSARVLSLLLIVSVVQYTNTGAVTWLTDTFRWVETTARDVADNPGATADKAGDVVSDLAQRVGEALPGVDAKPGLDPKSDISWSAPAHDLSGPVKKVVDGDTLSLLDTDGQTYKIRLFGIDSPEYGQPFFKEASKALSKLVGGKSVGVDIKATDSYGRTVGVVYVGGRNINLEMIRSGHAWWYKRYAGLNQDFREAEDHARAYQLGLWAGSNPQAPWEWRQQRR